MIEKVKLNEVAKDLNISGKDLTALLQERFGGEAKKPQTVLSGEELNFVMEHYTQQHAVKDFGEYFKLGEKNCRRRHSGVGFDDCRGRHDRDERPGRNRIPDPPGGADRPGTANG